MLNVRFFLPILVWILTLQSSAQDIEATTVKKSLKIGLSQALYADKDFGHKNLFGISVRQDFTVSQRSTLGISLTARTSSSINQLIYGVNIGHTLLTRDFWDIYFNYGLLNQNIFIADKESSALAHNARLAFGSSLRYFSLPIWLEVGYNISTLRYFDTKSQNANYYELALMASVN